MATLERSALGRSVNLGMLYDIRTDTLFPNETLWDPTLLESDRVTGPYQGSMSCLVKSDSINDKCEALGVDEGLKASIMCGLVQCKGASGYLQSYKTSSHQARVALHHKITTSYEQLSFTHIGGHNVLSPMASVKGLATHVVTGIMFGAQAYFVFDQLLRDSEDETEKEEELHAVLERIFQPGNEGKSPLNLNKTEELQLDTICCAFHGDFKGIQNPANIKDVVDIYGTLLQRLGENMEHAVPIRIWLYPLANSNNTLTPSLQIIEPKVLVQMQEVIEGLGKIEVTCRDKTSKGICADFPQFKEKVETFRKLTQQHNCTIQEKARDILPRVRGGTSKEQELMHIFTASEQSPYSLNALTNWIKDKDREMNTVQAYKKLFPGCKVIRSRDKLHEMILDPTIDCLVCFSFTLVGQEDEYLKAMTAYVRNPFESKSVTNKGWCNDLSLCKNMRLLAKRFSEFAQANADRDDIVFVVTGFDDEEQKSKDAAAIFLYEEGIQISKAFEPPGKPRKPSALDISHNEVVLQWSTEETGAEDVQRYQVEYRAKYQPRNEWMKITTAPGETQQNVSKLNPNTLYEFRVFAECKIGLGSPSDSIVCTTAPSSRPCHVKVSKVTDSSFTVQWMKPSVIGPDVELQAYKISYKANPESSCDDPDEIVTEDSKKCKLTIPNLPADTKYRIWVSAIFNDGLESRNSEPLDTATLPVKRFAERLTEESTILKAGDPSLGEPVIFKVPLKRGACHSQGKYHTYTFGEEPRYVRKHSVIMVVGATGAGKSTLINGMINYIAGVDWTDPFRFKIIDEAGEGTSSNQAHSQTQAITSYTIYPNPSANLSFTLTIIDTPGFGDTRGIGRDRTIIDQIREFFSNADTHHIDHIDAIGFVAQASQARLTHTQRYVFDSILSLFGKDIEHNIMLLVTFADGQKPPVVDAIKEANIPCKNRIFKFNNSALYAVNGENDKSADDKAGGNEENFDQMFWKMGNQSLTKFFKDLQRLDPKSLFLTKEVLAERNRLEVAVEGLQPQIHAACCKLEELRCEHHILEQHETEIEANQKFEYEVEVPKFKKVDITGNYITNCSKCHFSCHYPCGIPNDADKSRCSAMTGGYCRICPGKCAWNVHFNMQYKFEYYSEKEKRTYDELQERYEDATGKKLTVEQVIQKHEQEFLDAQKCVFALITDSHQRLKRLEEIALKPNPLSTVEYVDLMIQAEKSEVKPDWKKRVRALEDIRKQADILGKIKLANFDPFENFKKDMKEKGKTSGKGWMNFLSRR